jgi:GT2 family glycosyltransferase
MHGMSPVGVLPLSVAIPTFGRDEVLIDTISQLLAQTPRAAELLIVDQTVEHDTDTKAQLEQWHQTRQIRWERRTQPSQPAALNRALVTANQPILLMLDDDIRIEPHFLAAHHAAFDDPAIWAVVGQVLQPGEAPLVHYRRPGGNGSLTDMAFRFCSNNRCLIENGISCNLSVRRDKALALGGFDENFIPPVAYRFDSDFCKRLVRAGGKIRFEPTARIHHLRAARGGTRSVGSHLTSGSPVHGVGDYYFAFRQGLSLATLGYVLRRPLREVCTRFHLRNPWWVPVKLIGEFRAFLMALRLLLHGPQYLELRSRGDPPGAGPQTG